MNPTHNTSCISIESHRWPASHISPRLSSEVASVSKQSCFCCSTRSVTVKASKRQMMDGWIASHECGWYVHSRPHRRATNWKWLTACQQNITNQNLRIHIPPASDLQVFGLYLIFCISLSISFLLIESFFFALIRFHFEEKKTRKYIHQQLVVSVKKQTVPHITFHERMATDNRNILVVSCAIWRHHFHHSLIALRLPHCESISMLIVCDSWSVYGIRNAVFSIVFNNLHIAI